MYSEISILIPRGIHTRDNLNSDKSHTEESVVQPVGSAVELWQELSGSALFCSSRSCSPIHHLNPHVLVLPCKHRPSSTLANSEGWYHRCGERLHRHFICLFCKCNDLGTQMRMVFVLTLLIWKVGTVEGFYGVRSFFIYVKRRLQNRCCKASEWI